MGKNEDRNRRQAERKAADAKRARAAYDKGQRALPESHRRGQGGRTKGSGG